jgi:hypothetical protein
MRTETERGETKKKGTYPLDACACSHPLSLRPSGSDYTRDSVTADLRTEFAIHIVLIQQRLQSCDRGWVTMYSLIQGNYKKARTGDKEKKRCGRNTPRRETLVCCRAEDRPTYLVDGRLPNRRFHRFVFQNFRQCEPQSREISAPNFFESFPEGT